MFDRRTLIAGALATLAAGPALAAPEPAVPVIWASQTWGGKTYITCTIGTGKPNGMWVAFPSENDAAAYRAETEEFLRREHARPNSLTS